MPNNVCLSCEIALSKSVQNRSLGPKFYRPRIWSQPKEHPEKQTKILLLDQVEHKEEIMLIVDRLLLKGLVMLLLDLVEHKGEIMLIVDRLLLKGLVNLMEQIQQKEMMALAQVYQY
ncbi:hypothetical protein quinque_015859 [Culex quinquefasciatus]